MTYPTVLALDMATSCGWCVVSPSAVAEWPVDRNGSAPKAGIVCGTKSFARLPERLAYLRFQLWADQLMSDHLVGLVASERPSYGSTANQSASRAQGWRALLLALCEAHNVLHIEVSPQTAKKSMTGYGLAVPPLEAKQLRSEPNGRAEIRRRAKVAMIDAARHRGFGPKDDNQADAVGIADVAIREIHSGKIRVKA